MKKSLKKKGKRAASVEVSRERTYEVKWKERLLPSPELHWSALLPYKSNQGQDQKPY